MQTGTPPFHPDLAKVLRALPAPAGPGRPPPTPAERRAAHEEQVLRFTPPDTRPQVDHVTEQVVRLATGPVPLRIYRPCATPGARPTVVWFHGGGWTTGSLDTADVASREICAAGAVVVSVGYRLAPEHPFPVGLDDCRAALRWAHEHAPVLGGDRSLVAVGGDSAGGNLAAVVALDARRRAFTPAGQLLVYPVTDLDMTAAHASRAAHAAGPLLTMADLRWLVDRYVPPGVDVRNPLLSPLHAPDLGLAPPAVVVTAELDPLRSEGRAYARALLDAGVDVVEHRAEGLIHGAFDMLHACPRARVVFREATADLLRLVRGMA